MFKSNTTIKQQCIHKNLNYVYTVAVLCIFEVSDKISAPRWAVLTKVFRGIIKFLQENAGRVTSNWTHKLSSTFFQTYSSLIII